MQSLCCGGLEHKVFFINRTKYEANANLFAHLDATFTANALGDGAPTEMSGVHTRGAATIRFQAEDRSSIESSPQLSYVSIPNPLLNRFVDLLAG